LGILVHSHVMHSDRKRRFKAERLQKGLIAGAAGTVFFFGEIAFSKTDAHRIFMGLAHASAGYAIFEFWNVLPAPPRGKKVDDAIAMSANYV
jgi:hypothetical protein